MKGFSRAGDLERWDRKIIMASYVFVEIRNDPSVTKVQKV